MGSWEVTAQPRPLLTSGHGCSTTRGLRSNAHGKEWREKTRDKAGGRAGFVRHALQRLQLGSDCAPTPSSRLGAGRRHHTRPAVKHARKGAARNNERQGGRAGFVRHALQRLQLGSDCAPTPSSHLGAGRRHHKRPAVKHARKGAARNNEKKGGRASGLCEARVAAVAVGK